MSFNNLTDRTKGIIFIIISAFGFAVMSAFIKLSGDLPAVEKTFFRNLVSLTVAFIIVTKHKDKFFGKKENQKLLIVRSLFGTIGIVFNFYSIDHLILSDANMLNKLSPFFVIIFSAIFLKEKIKRPQSIALLIAMIGMLFVVKPSFSFEMFPALIGILGGVSAAAAYTCIRVLGGREKPHTIVFYFSLFSSVIIAPFVIMTYKPMTFMQFLYLICAGLFASIGQFGITFAYKYAPAKEISIFDYTNIMFAAIISFALFGALPDALSFIGYGIIFIAALYMFIFNKRLDKVQGA
ncbi:DMT family transporter [Clostridium vincentii]|uniref:Putative inner membrane transporter yiJE n=1 Tax=Clostridium vincentii TaxID=52704 RepID=A0A2T0B6T3_9CLOT|nr:DMT family transporter [Clostridium vincentii]PRR79523.1 putative inner membrane transporter yiJE [Clostridium vincentii]